jgi:O-antigen/teichoic acid export membrane protein
MFLNGIVLFSFYTLLTKHEWKPLVCRMIIAVLLSFSLNLWLIPRFGFVGATATSTVVHLFLALTLLPLAMRVLPLHFPALYVWRWCLFTVLIGALLFFSAPLLTDVLATVVGLFAAMIVLPFLAFLFGFHTIFSLQGSSDVLPEPLEG